MAKSRKRTAGEIITSAADRARTVPADGAENVTQHEVARRAYSLFLERGSEHGHDVEDWLQAERELHDSMTA